MNKTYLLLVPVLFSLLINPSRAEIYQCFDSAGRMITSDKPMPECKDKSTQVYRNDGILKDRLPAALTAEQRRAAKQQEQELSKDIQQQEQDKKERLYLTTHYPTAQDIEIARQHALEVIDDKISEEKKVIKVTTDALNKNQSDKALIPQNRRDDIMKSRDKEDELNQTIQLSTRMIQRYINEKESVNRQFDETRKRYIDIVAPDISKQR